MMPASRSKKVRDSPRAAMGCPNRDQEATIWLVPQAPGRGSMSFPPILRWIPSVLLGLGGWGCAEPEPEPEPGWVRVEPAGESGPLSIVVISMDTLRADRLGAYGNSDGLTPNLDRFAKESVVFENAFSQSKKHIIIPCPDCSAKYCNLLAT